MEVFLDVLQSFDGLFCEQENINSCAKCVVNYGPFLSKSGDSMVPPTYTPILVKQHTALDLE